MDVSDRWGLFARPDSVRNVGDQIPDGHDAADEQGGDVGEADPGDYDYGDVVLPVLPHLPM